MENEIIEKKLTYKQKAFIDAYLVCFNGAEAARRAGYSEHSARKTANILLADADINGQIQVRMAEVHMSADEALKLTADIARGDIAQLMDITSMGGTIDLKTAQERGLTKLIKKIKQKTTIRNAKSEDGEDSETHETELELYDAQTALRDILKVAGKFTEHIDLTTLGAKVTEIGIKHIDYRTGIADTESGSSTDSGAPSQD